MAALPAGGCVRDINTALTNPGNLPFYNNQVLQKNLDARLDQSATSTSSSATVKIPLVAGWCSHVELKLAGHVAEDGNPNIVWDPVDLHAGP